MAAQSWIFSLRVLKHGCLPGDSLSPTAAMNQQNVYLSYLQQYFPNRTAKATRDLFELSGTNRHGPPDELRSDRAHGFVGIIMAQCVAEDGYKHITTGGNSAEENLSMEIFWDTFAIAFCC